MNYLRPPPPPPLVRPPPPPPPPERTPPPPLPPLMRGALPPLFIRCPPLFCIWPRPGLGLGFALWPPERTLGEACWLVPCWGLTCERLLVAPPFLTRVPPPEGFMLLFLGPGLLSLWLPFVVRWPALLPPRLMLSPPPLVLLP